jgi:hypothetical protein
LGTKRIQAFRVSMSDPKIPNPQNRRAPVADLLSGGLNS